MPHPRHPRIITFALLALIALNPPRPAAQSSMWRGFVRSPDGTITLFGGPDAVQTWPMDINSAGTITGNYATNDTDENDDPVYHGFVREVDGTWTSFDVPDIHCTTNATAINDAGVVAGECLGDDADYGFIRAANGAVTTFLGPKGESVSVAAINPDGTVAGDYRDSDGKGFGYLRDAGGVMLPFRLALEPGRVTGLAATGDIWGSYGWNHFLPTDGFVRTADGSIKTFDGPGAPQRTQVTAINAAGEMLGYVTESRGTYHFIQTRRGRTRIDEPDGAHLIPTHFNGSGVMTGVYEHRRSSARSQGFVRSEDGVLTLFDVPGSTDLTPLRINDAGVVVGRYSTR